MSTALPVADPNVEVAPRARRSASGAPKTDKPNLTVVAAPRPRVAGTGVFSLVIAAILVLGMMLLLFLNITLAEGGFRIHDLTKAQHQLNIQRQLLAQSVAVAQSPEQLQRRARALGMVPSDNPVFIRLADGKILGTPIPAPRPPRAVKAAPASAPSVPKVATTAVVTTR